MTHECYEGEMSTPGLDYFNRIAPGQSKSLWSRDRPFQVTDNPGTIQSAIVGMVPGEYRRISADLSGGLSRSLNVDGPHQTLGLFDWVPQMAWDPESAGGTDQLAFFGKRKIPAGRAFANRTGRWRDLALPASLSRYDTTGHGYGTTVAGKPGEVFAFGHHVDLRTDTWTPLPAGNTGIMYLYYPTANDGQGGFASYGGNSMRWQLLSADRSHWAAYNDSTLAAGGNGHHAFGVVHPTWGKALLVGGTSTPRVATMIDHLGNRQRVADVPFDVAMSVGWMVPGPDGCWIVRNSITSDSANERIAAYWPQSNTWQDLGLAPDRAPNWEYTIAVNAPDLGVTLMLNTAGLHAWMQPVLTAP